MATTKAAKAERAEAIAQLRELIKPGDTVYTILDHVSSSGMSRAIRVLVPIIDPPEIDARDAVHTEGRANIVRPTVDFRHPNYAVGKALGLRHWKRNGREQDALVVGGCGMDIVGAGTFCWPGLHAVRREAMRLLAGEYAQVQVRTNQDRTLYIWNKHSDGRITGYAPCEY